MNDFAKRDGQMTMLDSRIREIISETVDKQIVSPDKRRLEELNMFYKSGFKPGYMTFNSLVSDLKKIQAETLTKQAAGNFKLIA